MCLFRSLSLSLFFFLSLSLSLSLSHSHTLNNEGSCLLERGSFVIYPIIVASKVRTRRFSYEGKCSLGGG